MKIINMQRLLKMQLLMLLKQVRLLLPELSKFIGKKNVQCACIWGLMLIHDAVSLLKFNRHKHDLQLQISSFLSIMLIQMNG